MYGKGGSGGNRGGPGGGGGYPAGAPPDQYYQQYYQQYGNYAYEGQQGVGPSGHHAGNGGQVGPAPTSSYYQNSWQYGSPYPQHQHQQGVYGSPGQPHIPYPGQPHMQPQQWAPGPHPYSNWEYHPVAPQQYPQTNYRQSPKNSREKGKQEKAPSRPAAVTAAGGSGKKVQETLECKNCQKVFKQPSQLAAHLSMHQVCGHDGCTFSAIPKVLKEHREQVHFKSQNKSPSKKKVVCLESEEEIKAYLAERRANYPSGENVRKKRELENKRKAIGQLEPDSAKSKRMKRLKEVLQTQKNMGVAKIAGTDKIGKVLVSENSGADQVGKGGKEEVSLVPYSPSDSEDGEEAKQRGKGPPKAKKNQNRNQGRQHIKKKEVSLVSKLLSKSIRKEKSHILQCFRFLVKTKFKMAFS